VRPSSSRPTASPPWCTRRPRALSLRTIDATCPLVTKVHREAVRFADEDYDILLIGHEGHEEVERHRW
jgi:4-hydroxy-3-methylbut-2-enyl diphosphate reductase